MLAPKGYLVVLIDGTGLCGFPFYCPRALRPGLAFVAPPALCREEAGENRTGRQLLGRGMVVVVDDAADFRGAVFVLPQVNEFPFTNGFCALMSRVGGSGARPTRPRRTPSCNGGWPIDLIYLFWREKMLSTSITRFGIRSLWLMP